ncbi:protein kinase domain protein [Gregarina niphandrodes]|uniref:Protein kinase domain protein n=1 Tax=Gregarina niphandrodes TaxID=110365 RepID=A0A023B5P1_GRENI|nr:protein kinase domain protein [Gregarina niphandrodes]EZG61425.1 protein kinase domain protein [Gregarina niphandrodes]|eukprot:XP_011130744.1 protein kinase domain protein [Gregarina niphandrodes]
MPEWAVVEKLEDAWPCAELYGYHLDRRAPGKSVLLTRKLSGPDLFDVIRAEHNHNWHFHHSADARCRTVYSHRGGGVNTGGEWQGGCVYYPANYEFQKLRWCALALHRLHQYAVLSIRHNDVKPDNIVLDFHYNRQGHKALDVKLIDLGTASMYNAKDFTGGTSWYESPEQKLLEYFMKKKKNPEAARRVDIGLSSDIWGAGISLTEVLVGRRVVDSLKCPAGPGSLDYLGYDAARAQGRSSDSSVGADYFDCGGEISCYPYWAMDPAEWLMYARRALGLEKDSKQLCHEAAKWLFDHLARPEPSTRASLLTALDRTERFAEEAYQRYRYTATSFQHKIDGYEMPRN